MNIVIITRDKRVRDALVKVRNVIEGSSPVAKSESASASRAHYGQDMMETIINCASEHMFEVLGDHSVAMSFATENRVATAEKVADIFHQHGLTPTIHLDAEPEFPKDFLVFVSAPEANGVVILLCPRREDVSQEVMATLPKRTPWGK